MTERPRPATSSGVEELTPEARAHRDSGIRMMVLGAVLAVLAPLGGFLAGSIVGPSRSMGDFDAMFVWMFAGLLVGGVGAVVVLLGLLRWSHATRHRPPTV
jgi:hypothetical protein